MPNPAPIGRVAFVHTVGVLVDRFRKMAAASLPGVDAFHVLNESLLQDLLRDGPSAGITRRVVQQAALAADAGATLVVFTCSSTSPAVDVARELVSVPILKIDDPMAEQATSRGGRVGVICTTRSTVDPSTALLKQHAKAAGSAIEIETVLLPGAYDALFSGDVARHDEIVREAAVSLAARCDVLVLAQASIAHLQEPLSGLVAIPVLASPPLLMARLRGLVSPGAATV
jgi:Asp/Glu/hydantoin racemase